jgi:hypothetical protein
MACPNVRRENLVVFRTSRFYYLEHDQSTDDPLQKALGGECMKELGAITCLVASTFALAMLSVLFALKAAAQTRPETHTVEILSAEETHWTTTWDDPGDPGKTSTDCTDYGAGVVSCTSTTTGARAASSTPIHHTRVDILVRMPDGNEVKMQCHFPPPWAACSQKAPCVLTEPEKVLALSCILLTGLLPGQAMKGWRFAGSFGWCG